MRIRDAALRDSGTIAREFRVEIVCRPRGALNLFAIGDPRLTPWALFWRRFGAGVRGFRSVDGRGRPSPREHRSAAESARCPTRASGFPTAEGGRPHVSIVPQQSLQVPHASIGILERSWKGQNEKFGEPGGKYSPAFIFFRPFGACSSLGLIPTAYAVGFILVPLRGETVPFG